MKMASIDSIHVYVETGSGFEADTDGSVYLGICGREFYLDSNADDFEKGAKQTFKFGLNSNIKNSRLNDPREQWRRYTKDLEKFPVYIRFESKGGLDKFLGWHVNRVLVTVNPWTSGYWQFGALKNENESIWLGESVGKVLYLELERRGEL